jgi:hypothetical protein
LFLRFTDRAVTRLSDALLRARHVFALLKKPDPGPADEADLRLQALIDEFDALDGEKKDAVARAIWLLWTAFRQTFEGMAGFMEASEQEQDAYLAKIRKASESMSAGKDAGRGHYYYATSMMLSYVSGWRRETVSKAQKDLSEKVVAMIDRQRQAETEGSV